MAHHTVLLAGVVGTSVAALLAAVDSQGILGPTANLTASGLLGWHLYYTVAISGPRTAKAHADERRQILESHAVERQKIVETAMSDMRTQIERLTKFYEERRDAQGDAP